MDPLKRMTRPAADYMARGSDPAGAGVHQARMQREAEQLFVNPGARVPNNPKNALGARQAAGQQQVYANLYDDWRIQGLSGTGVTYAEQQPAWPWAQRMSPQPEGANGTFDMALSQQIAARQPLSQVPPIDNALIGNPGLAQEVARRGDGGPMGLPLPPTPPARTEDLLSAVPVQVLGSPSDALFPRPQAAPVRPGKGRPASMPKPAMG